MKKHIFAMSALTVFALSSQAQETIKVSNVSTGTTMTAVQNPSAAVAPSGTVAVQTTTVVNPTPAQAPAPEMVKQPTTVVEAAPLTTSRAEELRKQREQSEVETEQRIVEKLEESRMEAEKKRQAAILGSFGTAEAVKQEEKKQEAAPAAAAAPVPVVVEVKQPEPQPQTKIEDVRAAVREELAASQKDVVPEVKPKKQSYFRGTLGMLDYDSSDIRTVGAIGATFGKLYDDQWALELSVLAANAYVDESNFLYRKLEQFNIGVGTRFIILPESRIKPTVGFLVDFVNRQYSDLRDAAYGFSWSNSDSGSWAIDYGLVAGVDFAVSENLNLGMEYRFMTNLTYEFDDEFRNTPAYRNDPYWGGVTPLEERDSSMLGFSVKYLF